MTIDREGLKFGLEHHLPTFERIEVPFLDKDVKARIDDFSLTYQGFESRLGPNFAFLTNSEKPSSLDHIENLLVAQVETVIKRQEKIRALGKPKEQINFCIKDQCVSVLNYLEKSIPEESIAEISYWVSSIYSSTQDKFRHLKNIFIVPAAGDTIHTGEPTNGAFERELDGVVLYPSAFKKKTHRTGGVSHLAGTLTHEWFHQYATATGVTRLSWEWMTLGGWEWHFRYPEKVAGKEQISRHGNFIESDYGSDVSVEELCDAGVKAIYNRDDFKNPAKRDFLDQNFLDFSTGLAVEKVRVARTEKPSTPLLPQDLTFTVLHLKGGLLPAR